MYEDLADCIQQIIIIKELFIPQNLDQFWDVMEVEESLCFTACYHDD